MLEVGIDIVHTRFNKIKIIKIKDNQASYAKFPILEIPIKVKSIQDFLCKKYYKKFPIN